MYKLNNLLSVKLVLGDDLRKLPRIIEGKVRLLYRKVSQSATKIGAGIASHTTTPTPQCRTTKPLTFA